MTNLRDARLQRALEHAPDAELAPSALIRENIKKIANNQANTGAIASLNTQLPWWTRFWRASGQARGPWNVALATVLLGGIITLLWRDQEVPGAAPQIKVAQAPVATSPAPASPSARVLKAETQEVAKAAPAPPVSSRTTTLPEPPVAPSISRADAPTRAPTEPSPPSAVLADTARRAEASAPALRQAPQPAVESPALAMQAPAPAMTANAPADAPAERSTGVAQAKQSAAAAQFSAPAVARAPVMAASPAAPITQLGAASAQPAAQASALSGAVARARVDESAAPTAVLGDWDEVDLQMPQRSQRWRKAEAPAFTARALALVRANQVTESAAPRVAFDAPPLLRLRWWQGANIVATLELWADRYRLQRSGQADLQGDAPLAEVTSVVAQAARR